jgi:VanZ family protein
MPAPRYLRPLIYIALAVHWTSIFILTHLPARHLPNAHINDKVEHFTAYFVLAVLLYCSLRLLRPTWRVAWFVLGICAAYGAIDEILQAVLPINRDCSFWDWSADVTGTIVALIVCTMLLDRLIADIAQRRS